MVLHAAHADSNDLPYEVQCGLTARLTGPGGHRLIQIHLHQNQLIPDAVLAKPLVLMDQRRLHHILLVLTLAVDGGVDFIPRGHYRWMEHAASLLDVVPLLPRNRDLPARGRESPALAVLRRSHQQGRLATPPDQQSSRSDPEATVRPARERPGFFP